MTPRSSVPVGTAALLWMLLTVAASWTLPIAAQLHEELPKDALPSLDDLRAPTAPAFVLLGVEPTTIERPQTSKALVVNVLSQLQESEGLPDNYAISFAPYWLGKQSDNLTWDEYFEGGFGQSFFQSLSFSLASSRPENEPMEGGASSEPTEAALGIGFRGLLIDGKAPQLATQSMVKLKVRLSEILREELDCIIQAEDAANQHIEESKCKESTREERTKASQETALEMQKLVLQQQRVGFTLEVAAGAVWTFPDGTFDEREFDRWGVWLTPAYRFAKPDGVATADILGVGRYIRDKSGEGEDLFDIGARIIWHPSKDLALSAEYVRRIVDGESDNTEDSDRLVAMLEYRISEDTYFVASYGEDFDAKGNAGELVSTAGIKFGLGKTPKLRI